MGKWLLDNSPMLLLVAIFLFYLIGPFVDPTYEGYHPDFAGQAWSDVLSEMQQYDSTR